MRRPQTSADPLVEGAYGAGILGDCLAVDELHGPVAVASPDLRLPQQPARTQIDGDELPVREASRHGALRHAERPHSRVVRVPSLVAPVLLAGPQVHRRHTGIRPPQGQPVHQGLLTPRPPYDLSRRDRGTGGERGREGAAGSGEHVPRLQSTSPPITRRTSTRNTPHTRPRALCTSSRLGTGLPGPPDKPTPGSPNRFIRRTITAPQALPPATVTRRPTDLRPAQEPGKSGRCANGVCRARWTAPER